MPGDLCPGPETVGDCRYAPPKVVTPPDCSWASIYERVIEGQCGRSCHAADAPERFESDLDLSDVDTAYEQMVGRAAVGAQCDGTGVSHIAPGDADGSLLMQKLEGTQTCGDSMPLNGALLPAEVIAPIRAWIVAGADRDATCTLPPAD